MRIAIWGAGHFGQYLEGILKNISTISVDFYVDNKKYLERNLPVISEENLVGKWENEIDAVCIAVSDYYAIGSIVKQLHKGGIPEVYIAKPELWHEKPMLKTDKLIKKYIYKADIKDKAFLTKLEYHVCDSCNLNCIGCSHFAPIFKDGFANIDEFRRDIVRLSEKFSNILRLRLMGGEPFLHKDITRFVETARKFFPNSHLEIVTNGLLLEAISQNTWDVIKRCDAMLNISLYPPTYKIREKLQSLLSENGIMYSFGSGLPQFNKEGIITEFHKNLTDHRDHNPGEAIKYCMGKQCHYLRDGKLSKCALPLLAEHINRYFKTDYIVEETDFIDIYNDKYLPWDIVERLDHAIPFCGYCISHEPERFKWSVDCMKIDIKDYIVEEQSDNGF